MSKRRKKTNKMKFRIEPDYNRSRPRPPHRPTKRHQDRRRKKIERYNQRMEKEEE